MTLKRLWNSKWRTLEKWWVEKKKVISECINTAHHITSVSEYNRHLSLVLISPLWKKAVVAIAVLLHSYNSFLLWLTPTNYVCLVHRPGKVCREEYYFLCLTNINGNSRWTFIFTSPTFRLFSPAVSICLIKNITCPYKVCLFLSFSHQNFNNLIVARYWSNRWLDKV